MYVRIIKRKNKDGSEVEYIQLAHNTRHPEKGYTRAEVVYSFGRRDQLDVGALKRLVSSLSRFISPEDAQELEAPGTGLKFISSRPAGGDLLLKGLWKRIGIDRCLSEALKDRDFTIPVGDDIFAMGANRALAPASKLAVEEWAAKDVHLDIEQPIQVQHLYRSMDFLLEHEAAIQEKVFWATAHLMNLTVNLIFFDTTNTYFEMEDPGDSDLLAYGKSKHKKDDLPQVTIGLAVTREGIPVRCWVLPGNQNDAKCVDQVQKDMNEWKLGNVIWAMDRGKIELESLEKQSRKTHLKTKHALLAHRSMGRYLKELKSGKLTVDKAKVKNAEKLDGKYLLSTSDKSLSAKDVALGYKQLMEVERAFRALKTTLSLRPVYHTNSDRIRAHVMLCWLALLLVRVTEVETDTTWPKARAELERLHFGEFLHKDGRILQYTEPTQAQRKILKKQKISTPKRVKSFTGTP